MPNLKITFKQQIVNKCWGAAFAIVSWMQHVRVLLDFRVPDYVRRMEISARQEDLNTDFEKSLDYQLGKARRNTDIETPFIFVFGEWGAGKTYQLLSYRNKSKKHIEYCSFWGINSVQEGLFHTIPIIYRFSLFYLFVLALLIVSVFAPNIFVVMETTKLFLGLIFAVFFTLILIPGRWKMLYAITAAISAPFWGERLVVLDDIERSSLDIKDQGRFLLSLWKYNTQYIIPIGHDGGAMTLEWRNFAAKLNGQIINLHPDKAAKAEWIRINWPSPIFTNNEKWLTPLTLRELSIMAEHYYDLTIDKEGIVCAFVAFKIVVDNTLDKLGIASVERHLITLDTWGGGGSKLHFEVNKEFMNSTLRSLTIARLQTIIGELDTEFKRQAISIIAENPKFGVDFAVLSSESIAQMSFSLKPK